MTDQLHVGQVSYLALIAWHSLYLCIPDRPPQAQLKELQMLLAIGRITGAVALFPQLVGVAPARSPPYAESLSTQGYGVLASMHCILLFLLLLQVGGVSCTFCDLLLADTHIMAHVVIQPCAQMADNMPLQQMKKITSTPHLCRLPIISW